MYLAQSVFGYFKCYETRLHKISDLPEMSPPNPTVKSSIEIESRLESDEHTKAWFVEQVGFVKSIAKGPSRLSDEGREALINIHAQIARLKKNIEI